MTRTRTTTTVVEPAPVTRKELVYRLIVIGISVGTSYISGRSFEKGKQRQGQRQLRADARKLEERAAELAARHRLDRPRREAFVRDPADKIPGRDA